MTARRAAKMFAVRPHDLGAPPKTLSDEAYRRVRSDLIAGRLVPGSRLRVDRLKVAYDIGASPLREALSRLASEGLVTAEGQRGFRASALSRADLDDVTRMRIVLETQAVEESVTLGDDAWEARVVAAHHRLTKVPPSTDHDSGSNDWEHRNRAFHDALVAACTSRWLLHFRIVIYDQHERYRRMAASHPETGRDVGAEHRHILEAALARDVAAVTRLSALHIERTGDMVRAALGAPDGFAESAAR